MRAVVVYESFWGNTAAVGRAIAEGIGEDARALCTDEATADVLAEADLLVVGAPVLGFSLPTDGMRDSVRTSSRKAPSPPDLSHRSMRAWLDALPGGKVRCAAFETRLRFSPGGATMAIVRGLEKAGYRCAGGEQRFFVKGTYGPLRDGELERAKAWGAELALAMG